MTYAEKLAQDEAYKEYEKHLAEQFETSEDGEFEISDEESQEWDYLNKTNQSLEDYDEPNTDS